MNQEIIEYARKEAQRICKEFENAAINRLEELLVGLTQTDRAQVLLVYAAELIKSMPEVEMKFRH